MDHYSGLLGMAIKSMVTVKDECELEDLFSDTSKSVKSATFKGLDDFELIAFVVVYEFKGTVL